MPKKLSAMSYAGVFCWWAINRFHIDMHAGSWDKLFFFGLTQNSKIDLHVFYHCLISCLVSLVSFMSCQLSMVRLVSCFPTWSVFCRIRRVSNLMRSWIIVMYNGQPLRMLDTKLHYAERCSYIILYSGTVLTQRPLYIASHSASVTL